MFDFLKKLIPSKPVNTVSSTLVTNQENEGYKKVKIANLKVGQEIFLSKKDPRRTSYGSYNYHWFKCYSPKNKDQVFKVVLKQPQSGPEGRHGGLLTIVDEQNTQYWIAYNQQTPVLVKVSNAK